MANAQRILDLTTQWRDHATTLREYGAEAQADTLERCAAELDDGVGAWSSETLTLQEAAGLSGYSADHIGRLVREGAIPNAGRAGAPRIARGDLPRRSGAVATVGPIHEIDRTQIVRSAINEGAG